MSSILETGNNKDKCQKFTPDSLVETMLDLANYKTDLIGKTVLENSFGTGKILKTIVARYIESALNAGVSVVAIAEGLSQDIYGIEIDKELFEKCISDLNAITAQYALPSVEWNLINGDALETEFDFKFDYIIGNPPYISYKEMDGESRKTMRKKFESCSIGKFDYCYAFIEFGIKLLKSNGKLVQLIPNNIYKNVFAQKLRDILREHISWIYDYPSQRLFDKALTSVSVFLYEQDNISDIMHYKNMTYNFERIVKRSTLDDKWMFINETANTDDWIRFGDIFHASITIATLYNKAFLLDSNCIKEEHIESAAIRAAVSPKSLRYQKEKFIIFPYKYDEEGLTRYSAAEFKRMFPNAAKHLQKYSDKLEARNSDIGVTWFEYGRSQALAHLNTEKIVISTIITGNVESYIVDKDTIPFSGIYVTIKDDRYNLNDAVSILKSEQFAEYVRNIGISVNGKSMRITCKDINNYRFRRNC